MNDIKTITIIDNEEEKQLYLLSKMVINNNIYIFYVKELKNKYLKDDVYVGKIDSNKLIPVNEKLMKDFDVILDRFIK